MQRRDLLGLAALGGLAGCATPSMEVAGTPPMPSSVNRIVFASCADESKPQPLWDAVLAGRPDLVVFGGDNVYYSDPQWTLDGLKAVYAAAAAEPHLARLRRAVPHMAIWDDNDYGQNDGGADFSYKVESKAAFLDFWKAPANDPRRGHGGVYDARVFGPPGRRVQVILVDVRWFRSPWKPTDQRNAAGRERYVPDADPGKTMLGNEQWQWLAAQLRQPADVRVIVSGIQVVAEGHGWERWGNFPLERQRLYRLIAETRANGVVFVSGDRHFGAMYRETTGTAYPLYEMTASGVTHSWRDVKEAGPNRIGAPFGELNFGTLDIDWARRSLVFALKDMAGAVQRSQPIALDELQVKS